MSTCGGRQSILGDVGFEEGNVCIFAYKHNVHDQCAMWCRGCVRSDCKSDDCKSQVELEKACGLRE